MALFSGLSAFPLTPTDRLGQLLPAVLIRHLERLHSAGVGSIGLLGSTGSYPYLSAEERLRVLRIAVEHIRGTPIVVGVGALRTDQAEELARQAQDAGADGLLLAPVSYQKLTDEEVFDHFKAVAMAGRLPLCIYNNPAVTNFAFSHDLIARLSRVPHIAGVKMPQPADGTVAREVTRLRALCTQGFSIGYSGDWGGAQALLAGADCWHSVIAGLLPEISMRLTKAAQSGDAATVTALDQAFQPLWDLFKAHGSFRVAYAIAALDGDTAVTPIRPVQPLLRAAQDRVRQALAGLRAVV